MTSLYDAIAATAQVGGGPREPSSRGARDHRRRRHRQPDEGAGGLGHRELDRRAGVSADGRQPARSSRRRISRSSRPPASTSNVGTLADLARWTGGDMRICSMPEHTRGGCRRSVRRAALPVPHHLRAGPASRLASARDSHPEEEPCRTCARRIHGRGAYEVWSFRRKSQCVRVLSQHRCCHSPWPWRRRAPRRSSSGRKSATVNSKVDTLERDRRADAGAHPAGRSADRPGRSEGRSGRQVGGGSAEQPPTAAQQAAPAGRQDASTQVADRPDARTSRRGGSCVYEVTLSEDQGNFKFGKTDLPDEAKARLDQVVGQLKGQPGQGRLHRGRGPHRQRRRRRRRTTSSAWSAPKR